MRLVFVHGIHEEHKAPAALRQGWENALLSAWAQAGLPKPDYTLEMPYYGNLLADLAEQARGAVPYAISASVVSGTFTRLEHALIHDIGKMMGIDAAHFSAEIADDVMRSDFAGCEWVQGVVRVLESAVPGFGPLLLRFARQVDAYLTCPEIRDAVDNVVRPPLLDGPTVIVAHSLGSIVAYRLLREAAAGFEVPLFVTLGSPLGIHAIKNYLNPPALAVPTAVRRWLNATDERDCIALHARLDRDTFTDGIDNVADVRHGSGNPHAIADYLGDATVARGIHAALYEGQPLTPPARRFHARAGAASP